MSCKDCKCGKKNVDLGAEAELRTVIRASQVEDECLRKQIKGGSIEAPELQYVRECYDPPSPWWKFWNPSSGAMGGMILAFVTWSIVLLFQLVIL